MKELKMWECQYCKKLFRTETRHDCKYDPDNKNCFTCEHNKGFFVGDEEYERNVYPECDLDLFDGEDARYASGYMGCESHVYCGKWHENEHAKMKLIEAVERDRNRNGLF